VPFEQLLAFDARFFPAPRPGFLAGWISLPESSGLAAVEDGELRGFGVRRRCRNGHKIGPLYAASRAIAERLFDGLCEGIAVSRSSSMSRSPTWMRSHSPKGATSSRRSRPPGCIRARRQPSNAPSSMG
jgi:hypothetical protein